MNGVSHLVCSSGLLVVFAPHLREVSFFLFYSLDYHYFYYFIHIVIHIVLLFHFPSESRAADDFESYFYDFNMAP